MTSVFAQAADDQAMEAPGGEQMTDLPGRGMNNGAAATLDV